MKSLDLKYKFFLLALLFVTSSMIMSCGDDEGGEEEIDTTKIELLSFGPSPVLRGGELLFIGRNLDQVTSVVLPDNISITSFNSKTATRFSIIVPEATIDGFVTLKTPQGDIQTKTLLTISEPITIASVSPAEVRPGGTIKITGTYLNLIKEVVFSNKKSVLSTDFVSQSQTSIEVVVPLDAQSGKVVISNGEADPILVASESDLIVTLPAVSAMAPSPVKAGSLLTISGTDLDLVKEITFGGGHKVIEFLSQTAEQIEVTVPTQTQDGTITLSVASLLEVKSTDALTMVVPAIAEIAPDPVKPGTEVTLTGSDLDLVTSITFGGEKGGTINAQNETTLVAVIPLDALVGVVSVRTAANKSVSSANELGLVVPEINSVSPLELKTNTDLTISGTNLDLVTEVSFSGDTKATPHTIATDQLIVTIPPGTQNGTLVLKTTNGTLITSSESLSILASNVPSITEYPAMARPGDMITLIGDKLDLFTDVIFPDNILATQFGVKTQGMMEVVVPLNVKLGLGVITFITSDGESTTSPPINFQGVDPVQDLNLVFFDFNGTGAKDLWWGNAQIVNDENSLDGSSYAKINGTYSGWTDLFWRNSNNNFPGAAIGTNVSDYVLKLDINIQQPITGGNLKLRLNTSMGDFWWAYGPAKPYGDGATVDATNGWVTLTVEINEFRDNYAWGDNRPTDLSDVPNEFGMAFDNGDSVVDVWIDNVRFERK
jgi:hypothetical protein